MTFDEILRETPTPSVLQEMLDLDLSKKFIDNANWTTERGTQLILAVIRYRQLLGIIARMNMQHGPDRCVFDEDELYHAVGLPPVDKRVGDKFAMAKDCMRFIDVRCEGGHWRTYAELEEENLKLKEQLHAARNAGHPGDAGDADRTSGIKPAG